MFAEDLSVFFSTAEFAVAATLAGVGAGTVIFNANGLVLEELGVQTSGPTALCPASQWPTVAEAQALAIDLPAGSTNFVIRVVTPLDDGALVLLTLARQ